MAASEGEAKLSSPPKMTAWRRQVGDAQPAAKTERHLYGALHIQPE